MVNDNGQDNTSFVRLLKGHLKDLMSTLPAIQEISQVLVGG